MTASVTRIVIGVAGAAIAIAQAGSVSVTGAGGACGMQKNDAPVAFCETFDNPFPVTNRSGQLDGTLWGVSRLSAVTNIGQDQSNAWAPATIDACDGSRPALPDATDVIVCNGQLREVNNDSDTVTTLAIYPKQPFDFTNRTGTVAFDVTNDNSGIHGAWPEFWITDQPVPAPMTHGGPPCDFCSVPRNGFGIRFAAIFGPGQGGQAPNCSSDGNSHWTTESIIVVRNYVVQDLPMCCNPGWLTSGCATASSGPNGALNHVELRISQSQIEVWATDAGATQLQLLSRTPNVNLSFTRGLIWLEDVHYNASKSDILPHPTIHTFTWDNVAFDGPKTYRDLSFDVLDRLTPSGGGVNLINLGWGSSPSSPANLLTLPMTAANIQAATGALFMFNYGLDAISTFNYTINGHVVNGVASPFPPGPAAWRSVAFQVPLSYLVPGPQRILLSGNGNMNVTNVNIVLVAAAQVPGDSPNTPTNLRVIRPPFGN